MFRTSAALISVAFLVAMAGGVNGRDVRPVQSSAGFSFDSFIQPGTVAHWRFAGAAGSAVAEEAVIKDAAGRFDALVFGGPLYRLVESRPGLEFSGGDDRVFVKDDPAFALTDGLTLEAIVRYDGTIPGTLDQHQIVFRGDDRPGLDPWFLAVAVDGRLMFHICGEGDRYVELRSPKSLPVGRVVHVAGVLDVRCREMRMYVDGEMVALSLTNLRPMADLEADAKPGIGIGHLQSGTYPEGFNGLICEVRISSGTLAPQQMLTVKRANGSGRGGRGRESGPRYLEK